MGLTHGPDAEPDEFFQASTSRTRGSQQQGSILNMTLDGNGGTLHSFGGSGGSQPVATVVQGTDGTFDGATV